MAQAVFARDLALTFAAPPAQRYLRLSADRAYAVWARRLTVEPQQLPLLEITWAVERLPQGAALDVHGRVLGRPVVLYVPVRSFFKIRRCFSF